MIDGARSERAVAGRWLRARTSAWLACVLVSACASDEGIRHASYPSPPSTEQGADAEPSSDSAASDGGAPDETSIALGDSGGDTLLTPADAWVVPSPDGAPDPPPDVESTDAAIGYPSLDSVSDTGGGPPDSGAGDTTVADATMDTTMDTGAPACPPAAATPADPLRVLFLGNSYTSVNDLPGTFRALAASAGREVVVDSRSPGGWSLGAPPNAHASDPASLAKVASDAWDVVVLQEQSQLPTIPYFKDATMIPGATSLDEAIHANDPCTRTMLYMTWGREKGGQQCGGDLCSPPFADFAAMQAALADACLEVAALIGAAVAPVGIAWQGAMDASPTIDLFAPDGSHPTKAGTYLAACVFYAAIFGDSPEGLAYAGGLPASDAAALQAVAAETVLTSPDAWFLP